jgi:hypothetical protein
MSDEAVDALQALFNAGECHLIPASSPLIYLIDGVSLALPIAKRRGHYKELHWLPCILKIGPDPKRMRQKRAHPKAAREPESVELTRQDMKRTDYGRS